MAAIPVDPREELERLERKHAENPEGRYFVPLADAHRRSGDLSGAIDLLRAGLARHPEYLSAHVVLGRCYADGGEIEAAEAEFRHVLSLDPQNLIALRTLGDIAAVDGRRREAERWYQDLVAVDPMNDDARAALSQLQQEAADRRDDAGEGVNGNEGADEPQSDAGPGSEQGVPERYELEDGVGGMMDLRSDHDRGALFDEGPDVVVTETIAELYTRQGFFDRAADVYRELIRRRGGDEGLEAKLRRVEALATGAPDPESIYASPESRVEDRVLDEESGDAHGGASSEVGLPEVSAMEDGEATSDLIDPFYPLIGPVGEMGSEELVEPHGHAEPEVDDLDILPAYDFATAAPAGSEGTVPESDDLDDLLIDPYADPFAPATAIPSADLSARSFASTDERSAKSDEEGFGDGLVQDPFADSFAEGFPALDDDLAAAAGGAIPIAGIANLEDDDGSSLAPAEGLTIGAFLKSVSSWRPSTRTGATAIGTSAASEPGEGPGTEPDEAHDEADSLGDTLVEVGPGPLSEATPAEPSGADDLQLVSGVDDLFPWEIPLPEAAPPPSVQPLDLDPGYPFDAPGQDDAPSVVDAVHAERTPSDAVDPDLSSELDEPQAEQRHPEPESTAPEPGMPYDLDDDMSGPASSPAATQDDDDLESFQAWLRSLKR